MRRWVSTFERLPLFTTRELQEHTDLRRPRPRPDVAAPHLVVLAVGASVGARQRRLHLPPMTPRTPAVARPSPAAAGQPGPDPAVDRAARRGARRDAVAGGRSSQLSLDFLSEVVLYAVSVADLTLMLALVFVLARNILKLVVERRRALPFARFRAKLVAALLGLTLIPAVLVLIVGSEIIRNSASRWFSAADRRRCSARRARSPATTTPSGTRAVTAHAAALARALVDRRPRAGRSHRRSAASSATELGAAPVEPGRGLSRHRARDAAGGAPVVEVAAPSLPPGLRAGVRAGRRAPPSGGQNWSFERAAVRRRAAARRRRRSGRRPTRRRPASSSPAST